MTNRSDVHELPNPAEPQLNGRMRRRTLLLALLLAPAVARRRRTGGDGLHRHSLWDKLVHDGHCDVDPECSLPWDALPNMALTAQPYELAEHAQLWMKAAEASTAAAIGGANKATIKAAGELTKKAVRTLRRASPELVRARFALVPPRRRRGTRRPTR